MGLRNVLVEGVSGSGRTSVCYESSAGAGTTPSPSSAGERATGRTGEDTPPDAVHIDATRPLMDVLDDVLRHAAGEQE